jgi:hypothetical protein
VGNDKKMKAIITILAMITLSGCVPIPYPHRVTDMPQINGTLIDELTGEPVENITVIATKYYDGGLVWSNDEPLMIELNPLAQQNTLSCSNGGFIIEKDEHWQFFKFLWLGPIDFPHFTTAVSLSYKRDPKESPTVFPAIKLGHKLDYVPYIGYDSDPKYGPYRLNNLKIDISQPDNREVRETPAENLTE